MANRQIPNLTPVVFLSPTAQLEVVQDGTTYRTSAAQIANLASTNASGQLTLVNNTTATSVHFPVYANVNSGNITTLYASDPHYQYIPVEGRLTAYRLEASQGLVMNNSQITLDYTIPAGDNAMSMGPVTVSSVITVPTGSVWGTI
jgi:hypothetical protein